MKRSYIAKTFQGLEKVLETELHELGIYDTTILNRSVKFEADMEEMILANLSLRTALRIYMHILEFDVKDEQDLYQKIKKYDWSKFLTTDKTFSIESVVASRQFVNSHFIALKSKDAIVDYFYAKENKRPSIDTRWPNLRIQVYISKTNHCVLSIDTSGEPLYKRGYKKRQTEASINECLAAGMILMTGWHGERDFYDLMTGSGTFTAEALMIASQYPPNIERDRWAFSELEGFQPKILKSIQNNLRSKVKVPEIEFYINDKSNQAFDIAKMNIFDLKVNTDKVHFSRDDFFELLPKSPGILLLNPPYDERLSLQQIELFYKDIGDMLKRHYIGSEAWLISSNKSALRKIGLKPEVKIPLTNGALACEFCQYKIFE